MVDAHVHITPDGKWFSTNYNANVHSLLEEMDKNYIGKAIILGLAEYIDNEFIIKTYEKHSDRLIPCISINASKYSVFSKVNEYFERVPYKIIKLHPRFNKYELEDEVFLDFLHCQKNICVWLDTLSLSCISLYKLGLEFPSITFILSHGCGSRILELYDTIRGLENMYIDISYTICKYKGSSVDLDLKFLFENFDRRMIFGSDFPEFSISETMVQFNRLTKKLDIGKKNSILKYNIYDILEKNHDR